MTIDYVHRPISDTSPFTGDHVVSPFTIPWSGVMYDLTREVESLNGQRVVIEVDVPERGVRADGMLRADVRPLTPAVRVSFESMHGPITMATDRFVARGYKGMKESWRHNVYAIALALEALRKVDRYGVSRSGEQYRGYKAIEGAGPNREGARLILAKYADVEPIDVDAESRYPNADLFRWARVKVHPDRMGGDRTAWDAVEAAGKILGVI